MILIFLEHPRIYRRVQGGHGDLVGQVGVAVEQRLNLGVLLALGGQQGEGHRAVQRPHDAPGLIRQGIQGLLGEIQLGIGGGQRAHSQVHADGDEHHDSRRKGGIAACPQGAYPGYALARVHLLHALHLRFSRACTVRNRHTPLMDRKYTTPVRSNMPPVKVSNRSNTPRACIMSGNRPAKALWSK